VPTGDYIFEVKEFKLALTKPTNGSAPKPKLAWTLQIISPEIVAFRDIDGMVDVKTAGRRLYKNNMFGSQQQIDFLKQDLFIAGLAITNIRDLEQTAVREQMLGVMLKGHVKTELDTKTKKYNSNVYIKERLQNSDAGVPSVSDALPVIGDNGEPPF
jgi:hypothetical protein